MKFAPIPYLIVAMDYATTCAGTCPTCVLSKAERGFGEPAATVSAITKGLAAAGANYEYAETLAVGIGRANVLLLPETSVSEIVDIMKAARRSFNHGNAIAEISTSLIGKMEPQIERAKVIIDQLAPIGVDARFVVVGNTALVSEKYWRNLEIFLHSMQQHRTTHAHDDNGDILQLALSIDSLPEIEPFMERIRNYGFPINLAWAPGHDVGARDEGALQTLNDWLAEFFEKSVAFGLDSSLVTRLVAALNEELCSVPDAARNAARSSEAVVYLTPDGGWHNGLFTALAEMDPVRFDPVEENRTMSGITGKELKKFMLNQACTNCPFIGACVSAGGHKIAQIVLRNFAIGTKTCPSGLRKSFERAKHHQQMLQ